jgi:TPR repeat protein
MTQISIRTAALIMGRTPRTVWRRIADGALHVIGKHGDDERTMVALEDVVREACVRIDPDDYALIAGTDAGDPDAQCELALLFLAAARPEPALQLLQQSARQHYPEAFYQIARCHIAGTGCTPDLAAGLAWLTKAANAGHRIAGEQIGPARDAAATNDPAALDALLDEIERRLVLATLRDTVS